MSVHFKITRPLLETIRRDLLRPHDHAGERVGFISCRVGALATGELLVLSYQYHPVEDDDYVRDYTVGAMMGPAAIRKAMQRALSERVGVFHIHLHDHSGRPRFSGTDLTESAKFVPDFWNVRPEMPHGAIVLSRDAMTGLCWHPTSRRRVPIAEFHVIGAPLLNIRG